MSRITRGALISTSVYLLAVVAANWLTDRYGLVWVAPGLTATAGTYAAGAALLARDFVQSYTSRVWVIVCIVIGASLSWALTDNPRLAAASGLAFLAAELVDMAVFTPLATSSFTRAAIVSNIVAAPVDTIAFLAIAGFPITVAAVLGQFVAKVLWATLLPLAVRSAALRASP